MMNQLMAQSSADKEMKVETNSIYVGSSQANILRGEDEIAKMLAELD